MRKIKRDKRRKLCLQYVGARLAQAGYSTFTIANLFDSSLESVRALLSKEKLDSKMAIPLSKNRVKDIYQQELMTVLVPQPIIDAALKVRQVTPLRSIETCVEEYLSDEAIREVWYAIDSHPLEGEFLVVVENDEGKKSIKTAKAIKGEIFTTGDRFASDSHKPILWSYLPRVPL